MAHPFRLRRSRGSAGAFTARARPLAEMPRGLGGTARSPGLIQGLLAIAVALSLLVATIIESAHEHEDEHTDHSAPCSLCQISHQGATAPAVDTPLVVESGSVHASAPPGRQLIAGTAHPSPHRSRAPPPSVSL